MKRFLRIDKIDKPYVKMINQSDKGFDLIIISDIVLKELLETINYCEENDDDVYLVWQMKFKRENYILYKKCKFSTPMDNYHPSDMTKVFGKRFKVTCESNSHYSESEFFKNKSISSNISEKYKDAMLLTRMLKIGQLNLKNYE